MAVQKTSISILQELMQRNQKPIPTYTPSDVVNLNGDFICLVSVDGVEAVGYGKTKKEAKHNSAKNAIALLQCNSGSTLMKTTDVLIAPKVAPLAGLPVENYVGALNEFCSKNSLSYPEYEDSGFDGQNFNVACSLKGINALGNGLNKKIAKQEAARVVLERIKLSGEWTTEITKKTLSKQICDEPNIKRITELYNKLTVMENNYTPSELNISSELNFSACKLGQLPDVTILPLEQDYPPIETSEERLKNMGIEDYTVSIFIKEPLMLIFKAREVIPSTFTLIQDGATYIEAKRILLSSAVKFIDILKSQ